MNMLSPFTGKEMSLHKEWRTMNFRKEEFTVLFHFFKCEDTGEQFEDEALSELNFNQLVNQYRAKHVIPFTEQIVSIRIKYEISAAKMSEILGFGTNVYRQYENGEVPSQSNARLIQLVEDPNEFRKLVNLCNSLNVTEKEKIDRRIESVLDNLKKNNFDISLREYFAEASLPCANTGYKKPDLSKFAEMVVYFTEKMRPWKTKLNKLLFYSDFAMFSQTGFSISGTQYMAISMGPVPLHFNSLFEYLGRNDVVDICYTSFPDGGTGEQFKPNQKRQYNPDVFTHKELEVMERVAERFRKTSTNEIIEISHKEKAWIENYPVQKIIDYNYSFELLS